MLTSGFGRYSNIFRQSAFVFTACLNLERSRTSAEEGVEGRYHICSPTAPRARDLLERGGGGGGGEGVQGRGGGGPGGRGPPPLLE